MNSLAGIQQKITRLYGRSSLVMRKYSPEILLGLGLIGGVTAAVMAAKATLKANDIVKETKKDIAQINKISEDDKNYVKEYRDRDMGVVYVQTGYKFAKLYGPSVGLGVLSISAILASHGIMARRQVALVAAYNLLAEGFKSYRARVIEELGEDTDKNYRLGLYDEQITENETDEEGKKIKVKKTVKMMRGNGKSIYAKFFDEASPQWRNDPSLNLYFIRAQQNYANDRLMAMGHLFLNEVYDMLGLPRTQAGAVVGCVMGPKGDNYVDFDIYNVENEAGRDFVNGYNRSILLDFNVDGVIYDLIRERV
jgi:hypothetical protein